MSDKDIIEEDLFVDKLEKEFPVGANNEESSTGIENDIPSYYPELVGSDYPSEYRQMVERFLIIYRRLPKIIYDDVHKEVSQLNVDSSPTPTLQLINLKLQKIQANKDRLAEIYQDVIRCYTFKKRAVSILTDSWSQFADGKSADKRKSDSAFRLGSFGMDLAELEALYNVCENVLRNLDSRSNAISR
ncbi:unnamed protein product, partial [marine sediment metagenome]